ncbi:MAG: hypothetical protein ACRDJI_10220 [Actinomycetota bacterium]
MKRAIVVALTFGLVAGSLAMPADAAKKPKKTTFYLHGNQAAGESELPETWIDGIPHVMDAQEPEGAEPKSQFVTNYGVGPNTECSGNGLYPIWKGNLAGTVVGNVKVTLHTVATPAAKLAIQLYPDASGGCNSALGNDFVPPATEAVVEVPPGPGVVEAVLPNRSFQVAGSMTLQIYIADQGTSPAQVRLFYDSASMISSVQFALK